MDSNENRTETRLAGEDGQIRLVMDPRMEEETIDLGRVFLNMKKRRRLFAWVLVLCLAAGICAGLLWHQLKKAPLTVSSVVMLRYEAPVKVRREKKDGSGTMEWVIPDNPKYAPVTDLSAPDGSALDVNRITSAYVLQEALNSLDLPAAVTISGIRANISIQTYLTEESRRTREALSGLADIKNVEAYRGIPDAELGYQSRFVVTLKNGWEKAGVTDEELRLLLDRILSAYNHYLVMTYADVKLPGDAFSAIDTQALDISDSLDRLQAGIDDLYDYCSEKTDTIKSYRSRRTGWSLEDWAETLRTFRSIDVDSLLAMVNGKGMTRDRNALLTGWKYSLMTARNELDKVNKSIKETEAILSNYKNDEIFISLQDSDTVRSTRVSTEYFNELILRQAADYEQAAKLKAVVADYEDRISRLDAMGEAEITEEAEAMLARSVSRAREIYEQVRAHMEEVFSSPMYTTYEEYSAAQGQEKNFIKASAKKVIIGGALGAVIGLGIWFLAGLAADWAGGRKEEEDRKEAAV